MELTYQIKFFSSLNRVHLYYCSIILLREAQLIVRPKDKQKFEIPQGSLCYVDKNTEVDVILNAFGGGIPYEIYHIDKHTLKCIYKIMAPLFRSSPQDQLNHMHERIFHRPPDESDGRMFEQLNKNSIQQHEQIYKIAYLLSKFNNIESLVHSLSVSIDTTFTEKIKTIIETNISK